MKDCIFQKIPIGNYRAGGWLKNQLRLQADGLCGNLDKIWPDVRDSAWLGGNADSWERLPCWLDGVVPLAFLLDDPSLKKRVGNYVRIIVGKQQTDGWLAPCNDRKHYDLWAEILMLKVLSEYAEYSGDASVDECVFRGLLNLYSHIENYTIHGWAAARWFEALFPIRRAYALTGDKRLLDLANILAATGFDYEKLLKTFGFDKPREKKYWNFFLHNVNLAMALKSQALYGLFTEEGDDGFAENLLEKLLEKHGLAIGHFSGDECLSGTLPTQGTELCGIAEGMFSAETLLSITGNPRWGDYLDTLAFNALPAAFTPDMWAHQYDQQINQIECSRQPDDAVPFNSNNGEAHLFGLEPHYGCCTANHGQAFPKFALSAIQKDSEGLAVLSPVPVQASDEINGIRTSVEILSEYPFRDCFRIKIDCPQDNRFHLKIRIPGFIDKAVIDGKEYPPGNFADIEKTFGHSVIDVKFVCTPRLQKTKNGMYILRRGALFYALPLKFRKKKSEYTRPTSAWASYNICTIHEVERKFPYCDYEFFPESPWNYAFASDNFTYRELPVFSPVFSPKNPPCAITCEMTAIPWEKEHGMCKNSPKNTTPLTSTIEKIEFIPYGATILRMSEMPKIGQ